MKIEIQDDNTITLDGVKYVRVGEPAECEKDVVTTTTPLIDADGRYLTEPEAGAGVFGLYGQVAISVDRIGSVFGYLEQGNVFATEEAAIREAAVRAAWQRIRKWKAENAPFVEDWSDKRQAKFFHCYNCSIEQVDYTSATSWKPLGIPVFFGSDSDSERCLRECESEWRIIAGLDAGNYKAEGR